IEAASMSGEGRRTIHRETGSGGWPNGLTVDYMERRIVWIDARSDAIYSAMYDGSGLIEVLRGHEYLSHPFAVTMYGGEVYWTDWRTNTLAKANKWTGHNVTVVQRTNTQPFDLQVYHPSRQPLGNVSVVICMYLLWLFAVEIYIFVWILFPESRKFLLYARQIEIRGVDIDNPYYNYIISFTVPDIDNVTVVDYDAVEHRIYWSDVRTQTIKRAFINGTGVETVVSAGDKLWWADQGTDQIGTCDKKDGGNWKLCLPTSQTTRSCMCTAGYSLKTGQQSCEGMGSFLLYSVHEGIRGIPLDPTDKSDALVPVSGTSLAVGIDFHAENDTIYWVDMGLSTISRAKRDQTWREDVVTNGIGRVEGITRLVVVNVSISWPNGISVDYEEGLLYWCDARTDKIERINLETGENRELVLASNNMDMFAVSVFEDYIYWSDRTHANGSIKRGSKDNATDAVQLRTGIGVQLKDIKVFNRARQQGTNICKDNNGGCEQLCLYRGNGERTCACAHGMLAEDRRSCRDYDGYLLYSERTILKSIHLSDETNLNAPIKPFEDPDHMKNVIALSFDYRGGGGKGSNRIFFSDIHFGNIQQINDDGIGRKIVVDSKF
ncbi:hypothetical protein XENOCAPTIV_000564, partial [Xenoophorus captivus]